MCQESQSRACCPEEHLREMLRTGPYLCFPAISQKTQEYDAPLSEAEGDTCPSILLQP